MAFTGSPKAAGRAPPHGSAPLIIIPKPAPGQPYGSNISPLGTIGAAGVGWSPPHSSSSSSSPPMGRQHHKVAPAKGRVNRDVGTAAILYRAPLTLRPGDTERMIKDTFAAKKDNIVVKVTNEKRTTRQRRRCACGARFASLFAVFAWLFSCLLPKWKQWEGVNSVSLEICKTVLCEYAVVRSLQAMKLERGAHLRFVDPLRAVTGRDILRFRVVFNRIDIECVIVMLFASPVVYLDDTSMDYWIQFRTGRVC